MGNLKQRSNDGVLSSMQKKSTTKVNTILLKNHVLGKFRKYTETFEVI